MKTKNVLVIILSVLIFLSAVTLGISTVYRVDEVSVEASLVSEDAKDEVAELKARLKTAYHQKSMFSCTDTQAKEIVSNFPYFRWLGFKLDYPNRLVVQISEDAELFALSNSENGFFILGAEGTVLGIRDSSVNRADGAENVLLKGMTVTGEKGAFPNGDEALSYIVSFCDTLAKRMPQLRRNVVSIEVVRPAASISETQFIIAMREGVKILVHNPFSMTAEKANKALDCYFACKNIERLTGSIWVAESNGEVIGKYYADSYLPTPN